MRTRSRWILAISAILLALAWVTPFWLTWVGAFTEPNSVGFVDPTVFPDAPTFSNFIDFWRTVNYPLVLWNSIFISGGAALISVVMAFSMAYAIAIGKVRSRWVVIAVCVITFTMPEEAVVYPVYQVAMHTDSYGTQWPMIIALGILGSAFGTYLFSSVMSKFPQELLEAGRLDGAGKWRILGSLILPVMRPTIMAVATLLFVSTWNNYIFALLLMPNNDQITMPLALQYAIGERLTNSPFMQAGAVLSAIPSLLLFLIFQRSLFRGVTMSAER